MDQEGLALLARLVFFVLVGMEFVGIEDSLFTWEASSDGHSDVDVEGPATQLFQLLREAT